MMGVLHVNRDNKIFLDNYAEHKKIHLSSGQYIYFRVKNSWIPVIVKYSPESGRWCFCHMENININGREAMIKDYYDPEDPDSQDYYDPEDPDSQESGDR